MPILTVLDKKNVSCPYQDSKPEPSSPYLVATRTKLLIKQFSCNFLCLRTNIFVSTAFSISLSPFSYADQVSHEHQCLVAMWGIAMSRNNPAPDARPSHLCPGKGNASIDSHSVLRVILSLPVPKTLPAIDIRYKQSWEAISISEGFVMFICDTPLRYDNTL